MTLRSSILVPLLRQFDESLNCFEKRYRGRNNSTPVTSSNPEDKTFGSHPALAAQRRCSQCGHLLWRHDVLPNPELARWLKFIHCGYPECMECVDEQSAMIGKPSGGVTGAFHDLGTIAANDMPMALFSSDYGGSKRSLLAV